MLRQTVLWIALLASAAALGGCRAQEDQFQGRPGMEHTDMPRSFQRARYLEEQGLEEVELANQIRDIRRRREAFDRAIGDFREARDLYTQELLDDPGSPERQRFIEDELERLEALIEKTHAERPLGEGKHAGS